MSMGPVQALNLLCINFKPATLHRLLKTSIKISSLMNWKSWNKNKKDKKSLQTHILSRMSMNKKALRINQSQMLDRLKKKMTINKSQGCYLLRTVWKYWKSLMHLSILKQLKISWLLKLTNSWKFKRMLDQFICSQYRKWLKSLILLPSLKWPMLRQSSQEHNTQSQKKTQSRFLFLLEPRRLSNTSGSVIHRPKAKRALSSFQANWAKATKPKHLWTTSPTPRRN